MEQVLIFDQGEQEFSKTFELNGIMSGSPALFDDMQFDKGLYFWGYANVTTPDSTGDKFTHEALTSMGETLTTAPYNKIFLNHDYKTIPVGVIVATKMDSKGLLIMAKMNEAHDQAEMVAKSIENKSLDGFSIAGNIIEMRSDVDADGRFFNLITKATAKEVTLTGIPAHPEALVQGIFRKSLEESNKILTNNYINNKPFHKDMTEETKPETPVENNSNEETAVEETPVVEETKEEVVETKEDSPEVTEEPKEPVEEQASEEPVTEEKAEEPEKKEEVVEPQEDLVADLKQRNEQLEAENKELKSKLAQFEKAVKTGYEKAMSEVKDKPFRKSVKTTEDDSSASNSKPSFLGWLQR